MSRTNKVRLKQFLKTHKLTQKNRQVIKQHTEYILHILYSMSHPYEPPLANSHCCGKIMHADVACPSSLPGIF